MGTEVAPGHAITRQLRNPSGPLLTIHSGENERVGFDRSMAGFEPTELDLHRIVTDRCDIRGPIWKRGVYQAGLRRTGLDEVLVHWHQATQEATTISGGTPFSKCLDLEIFL